MLDSTQTLLNITVVTITENFNRAGLHPYEFRLYAHLARATNGGKRTCTEGQSRMARICKIDPATVRKYLRQLHDRNLIEIESSPRKREPYLIRLTTEPSIKLHQKLDEFGLQPYVFRVYVYLCGHNSPVQTALKEIATDCLMGKKSVQIALQALEQLNLITVRAKKGSTSQYELMPTQTWKIAPTPLKHSVKFIRGIGRQRNLVASLKQSGVNARTQKQLDQVMKQLDRAQAALRIAKQTFEKIEL